MSIHDQVDAAVKALVAAAAPGADVVGLDGAEAVPDRVPPAGRIAIGDGDPGDPEITLSPLTYFYDRAIAIEVAGSADVVRAILDALSDAIAADRMLAGLVDFVDARAPLIEAAADGAPVITTASATIVASYSTTRPL